MPNTSFPNVIGVARAANEEALHMRVISWEVDL